MAKFNITVDLDWINEDGEIDSMVKSEIINNVTSSITNRIFDEITKKAEEKVQTTISNVIDEKVNQIITELLSKKFDVTDRWGDVVKENASVMDMLKERLDNYFDEKVDKNGMKASYNGTTRLNYIIQSNIDYSMKVKIDSAAKEIKKSLENYIDTTLKTQIGENVAQLIGLNKITHKLNE